MNLIHIYNNNGRITKKVHNYCGIIAEKVTIHPILRISYRIVEYRIIYNKINMTEKKNQNRKQELAKKNAVESLRFQTHFGLKMMGREENDLFNKLADAEISFIAELDLTQDILDLKSLVDGVKKDLQVLPTPENGDFCTSVTAIALHIASIPSLDRMAMPVTWRELIDKKILTMYYPEDACNAVVDWTKANGYNTSTYLGRPIVKFSKIYVIIERARA